MNALRFTVYGRPQPQGSTRAFLPKGWTRPVITTDNAKLKPWRQELAGAAREAMSRAGFDAWDRSAAVSVRLVFWFAKPGSVSKKREFPTVKPDADKLARAVLDSLSSVVFTDDSQVADLIVAKRYGLPERVEVQVSRMHEAAAMTGPEHELALPLNFGATELMA